MTKHTLFSRLRAPKTSDRILLLTHTDMDGAGAAILAKLLFPNLEIKHCSNGNMSYEIKNAVMNAELNKNFDMFIACDISCNEHDAEVIQKSPNCSKLVVLDHHMTASDLNEYAWACVTNAIPVDSYRLTEGYVSDNCSSSGTSLMYDYLDYCGLIKPNIPHLDLCKKIVDAIALYDTWDWANIYDRESTIPYELNTLFDIYDTDAFEDSMISKIKNNLCNTMLDDTDIMVLAIEQHRINNHLAGVEKGFHTGNLKMNNKYYSVVFCSNDKYLNNTFDHMKDIYPDYDLYIINYGSGIGVRATKPDINVGAILKTIGGGGHAGAGGVKISLENQAAYLANALSADLYVDDPKDK